MSPDSPANLHWVKLTGVVDTTARGRIGDEPFGLLQKKIELLPSPRLKESLTILPSEAKKYWYLYSYPDRD